MLHQSRLPAYMNLYYATLMPIRSYDFSRGTATPFDVNFIILRIFSQIEKFSLKIGLDLVFINFYILY